MKYSQQERILKKIIAENHLTLSYLLQSVSYKYLRLFLDIPKISCLNLAIGQVIFDNNIKFQLFLDQPRHLG